MFLKCYILFCLDIQVIKDIKEVWYIKKGKNGVFSNFTKYALTVKSTLIYYVHYYILYLNATTIHLSLLPSFQKIPRITIGFIRSKSVNKFFLGVPKLSKRWCIKKILKWCNRT